MSDDSRETEENVYGGEAREALMEEGEISAEEEAFMEGYDHAEKEDEEKKGDSYEKAFAAPVKGKKKRRAVRDDDEEEE